MTVRLKDQLEHFSGRELTSMQVAGLKFLIEVSEQEAVSSALLKHDGPNEAEEALIEEDILAG
ncbi:MAG: hypothetical protein NTV48_02370 [Candidatus Vogelbacteria bacterium]|nr:hypothetical protein [Candidatus Vogelbacteria bacterium]